jgi:hypothetical protein
MGRGTGRGSGIGKIPFLGLIYFMIMAAAAAAFKIFLCFLAETNEISERRVEAMRHTIASVKICFLADMVSGLNF